MTFRDQLRRMHRDLHNNMQVPVLYRAAGSDTWQLLNVRLHTKLSRQAGHAAPSTGAQFEAVDDLIKFDRGQVALKRDDLISVAVGEAYRVNRVRAPEDEFQFAVVVPLTATQADGLPVPDDSSRYSQVVRGYLHRQTDPSEEWVINHNLGYRPVVGVRDSDEFEIEAEIEHVSVNQCVVRFVAPQTGEARCA